MEDNKVMETKYLTIIIFCISICLFIAGVILSFLKYNVGNVVSAYTGAIICLIFVFLPQFASFKGLGIEAVLKEKIQEADEIIRDLREVSLPIAELLFAVDARVGRMSAPIPRRERYRIMKQIQDSLVKIGVSPEGIAKAKGEFDRINMFDLAIPIIQGARELFDLKIKKIKEEINKAFPQPIRDTAEFMKKNNELNKLANTKNKLFSDKLNNLFSDKLEDIFNLPYSIEEFIKDCDQLTDEEKENFLLKYHEEIEDLKYYAKNREFRRLDEYFKQDDLKVQ